MRVLKAMVMAASAGFATWLWQPVAARAAEPVPDASVRARSYDVLLRRMTHYVDPVVGARVIAALRRDRDRAIAAPDNAAYMAAVNGTLRAASNDRHLQVTLDAPPPPAAAPPPADDFGIAGVRRLPGDIALLRLTGFSGAPASVPAIDAAMAQTRGARALIIDLRENRGGSDVSYRRLVGHLFPTPVELIGITWRTCTGAARPSPDMCVHGTPRTDRWFSDAPPRPAFPRRPVYVLTSKDTFSAGEALAYEMRDHRRGTIIGETTGGGGNPSMAFDLESAFAVIMPIGRHHVTGTTPSWEGTGVAPDVAVPADAALDRALALARRR